MSPQPQTEASLTALLGFDRIKDQPLAAAAEKFGRALDARVPAGRLKERVFRRLRMLTFQADHAVTSAPVVVAAPKPEGIEGAGR